MSAAVAGEVRVGTGGRFDDNIGLQHRPDDATCGGRKKKNCESAVTWSIVQVSGGTSPHTHGVSYGLFSMGRLIGKVERTAWRIALFIDGCLRPW